jgi:hypothetical protein
MSYQINSARFGPPLAVSDSDAQAYLTAVETADGQALEPDVRKAVNDFVVGCKADGIWAAINACCILMGARTLSGALVPLKGSAPTNFNFVAGDYNRKTGLMGNGTSKYLNSNRNNNADTETNHHLALYLTRTRLASEIVAGYRGTGISIGGKFLGLRHAVTTTRFLSVPNVDNIDQNGTGIAAGATSFMGFTRSASGTYTSRSSQTDTPQTQASTAPISGSLVIFALSSAGVINGHTTAKVSFYSIGANINLAQLDARVTALYNAINATLTRYDCDAQAYIAAVEAADGQALETSVKDAYDAFVRGCKDDGSWNAIKQCCILAGARTLAGALVPLKGVAPTNVNFVAGDYNRKSGLRGDGSTKYLNTNRNSNADPQDSHHMAVYLTATNSRDATRGLIGAGFFEAGATSIFSGVTSSYSYGTRNRSENSAVIGGNTLPQTGFIASNRASSTNYDLRVGGATTNSVITSQTPVNENYVVFGRNLSAQSDGRFAFYSIGESVNLTLLEARVNVLMESLPGYDVAAQVYIDAVEAADGQALENGVRDAINNFVVGCKMDGNWGAIQSCCILAGARTLTGALVSIRGAAPTNSNFVSGDYNRKTGLIGNGSTKSLSTNRAANVAPQNSHHMAVHVNALPSSGVGLIGSGSTGAGATNVVTNASRSRSATGSAFTAATGFVGISRSASTGYTRRNSNGDTSVTQTSDTPTADVMNVFARGTPGSPLDRSNARLMFYSVGEEVVLSLLNPRVTTLIAAYTAAIP